MKERPLTLLVAGPVRMTLDLPMGTFPASDGMHRTLELSLSPRPAGAGTEMALAVSRQKGRALLCASVGADGMGAELHAFLRGEGVDTRHLVAHKGGATPLTVRFSEEGESVRDATYLGVGNDPDGESLAEAMTCLPDGCLLSAELSPTILHRTASFCHDRRIPCLVDGVGADPAALKGLAPLFAVALGAEECRRLTGIAPFGVEEAMTAALSLSRLIPASYHLLWLADKGSYLYDGKLARFFPACGSQKSLSCAASAYAATFLLTHLRGVDPRAACRAASVASALASRREGDLSSLPTLEELVRAIKSPSYTI